MDIVIPYRMYVNRDTELRYALRSIEKYLSGFRHVIIVGEMPGWARNVVHIPCGEIDGKKQHSICNKILTACRMDWITDKFIKWHDDHFLLSPLHACDIKYWYEGTLQQIAGRAKDGRYRDIISNTWKKYGNPAAPYFDIHVPMPVEKEKFEKAMIEVLEDKQEVLIKSSYCYSVEVEGEEMADMKITASRSHREIMNLINGRLFFSTGHVEARPEMQKALKTLYSEKSKFEL